MRITVGRLMSSLRAISDRDTGPFRRTKPKVAERLMLRIKLAVAARLI
jgi:hypothetical protein